MDTTIRQQIVDSAAKDTYGVRAVQLYLLQILLDVDALCRANGICYSLAGGTLLGAVRYGGFIPWDDDVDIMFDRKNYQKFLHACANGLLPDTYTISAIGCLKQISTVDNPFHDTEYGCVDLFVFDDMPNSAFRRKLKLFILYTLKGMMKKNFDYSHFTFPQKVLLFVTGILGKPFSQKWMQDMYEKVSAWTGEQGQNHPYVNVYNTFIRYSIRIKFKADIIVSYVNMDFEGHSLMAICGYDQYLREQYGDYMKLPPIEDRKPSHHVASEAAQ